VYSVIAGCANSDCPFHVRAYFCHKRECVVVGTLKAEHTCSGIVQGAKRAPASKQSWLQRILPETITITKDTTPQQIIDAVQAKFQQTIRYEAAIRAKKQVLKQEDPSGSEPQQHSPEQQPLSAPPNILPISISTPILLLLLNKS
jgi:hypothetical protein